MTGVAILPTLSRTLLNRKRFFIILMKPHSGINFAVSQATRTNVKRPSVINISVRILASHWKGCQLCDCQIISDGSPALDEAVTNAVGLGIHVVAGALRCASSEWVGGVVLSILLDRRRWQR